MNRVIGRLLQNRPLASEYNAHLALVAKELSEGGELQRADQIPSCDLEESA
jgi:hypothetical protein